MPVWMRWTLLLSKSGSGAAWLMKLSYNGGSKYPWKKHIAIRLSFEYSDFDIRGSDYSRSCTVRTTVVFTRCPNTLKKFRNGAPTFLRFVEKNLYVDNQEQVHIFRTRFVSGIGDWILLIYHNTKMYGFNILVFDSANVLPSIWNACCSNEQDLHEPYKSWW